MKNFHFYFLNLWRIFLFLLIFYLIFFSFNLFIYGLLFFLFFEIFLSSLFFSSITSTSTITSTTTSFNLNSKKKRIPILNYFFLFCIQIGLFWSFFYIFYFQNFQNKNSLIITSNLLNYYSNNNSIFYLKSKSNTQQQQGQEFFNSFNLLSKYSNQQNIIHLLDSSINLSNEIYNSHFISQTIPTTTTNITTTTNTITTSLPPLFHLQIDLSQYQEMFHSLPSSNFPDLKYRSVEEIKQFLPTIFSELPKQFDTKYKNPCWIVDQNHPQYTLQQQQRQRQQQQQNDKKKVKDKKKKARSLEVEEIDLEAEEENENEVMNGLNCLPYFYILGQPKSGTSDLWNRLIKHPNIIPPAKKEVFCYIL